MPRPEDRSTPPPRWAAPDALAGLPPRKAQAVLLDAWVTDGRRGYFVDPVACAAGQGFSLYETMWQLHLLERSGHGRTRMIPSRVLAWAGSALDGRMPGSGLPPIGQLWYAVRILCLLGCRPGTARAGITLEALRSRGRCLAARAGADPDWGSTALAVAVHRELGLPVPAGVVAAAADAVIRFGRVTVPSGALTSVVSLVQVAADVGGARVLGIPATTLAGLVRTAESALLRLSPDPAWLAQLAALHRAAALLGVSVGRQHRDVCPRLLDSDGCVRLPGQTEPDAQATYYALCLDCPGARVPAPAAHSRAGWPAAGADAGTAASSVAALRSAAARGLDEPFRAPLLRQLTEVWLAGPHASEPDTQELARLLGRG